MDESIYDRIIGQIYAGVEDSAALAQAIEAIMRLVRADSAILFSLYRSTQEGGFWLTRNIDEAVLQNYYSPDAPVDAWAAPIPGVLALGHEVVTVLGDELIPEPALVRTEFHHSMLVPLDIRHLMGTPMRLDQERPDLDVALSLYRCPRQPRFDDASRALLRPLIRHLHRALYLAATLSDAQHRARTAEAALAAIGDGVLLLDADGRVLHATPGAEGLLHGEGGLGTRHGLLVAWAADEAGSLQALIARAAGRTGQAPRSGSMTIRRPAPLPPLLLTLFPIPAQTYRAGLLPTASVMLIARDPERRTGTEMDAFARHYGLSPAEVRLCRALARGQTLADHCAAQQVTRNTANTQLRNIFQKTGVSRQSALVRLMMAFGVGA